VTSRKALGEISRRFDPADLVETRLQLHYAAQLVAAVGRSLARRQPGFRHAALFWDDGLRGLAGAALEDAVASAGLWRAELRFGPPAIAFVGLPAGPGDAGAGDGAVALRDLTFDDAWRRLRETVGAAGFPAADLALKLPRDLPADPLAEGAQFAVDAEGAAALAGWFSLANDALEEAARRHGISGPIPCWGDHFDQAVVVAVGSAASVTLGFSPGDATIGEPYLYVLPWPVPDPHGLPGPPSVGGRWQTDGWVGLALPAADIAAADAPSALARSFLESGFELASALVVAA
jgi:hypothetical protein